MTMPVLNPIVLEGVDLFCGAGGTTTGVEFAKVKGVKVATIKLCVNHDPLAIASHNANHPHTSHFIEDIRNFNTRLLPAKSKNAKTFLWASLECTNFSNAKGGQSRDADSRTLANHLFRYIEEWNPDYVLIENVREFMAWGPLRVKCAKAHYDRSDLAINSKGELIMVPESRTAGLDYQRWVKKIKDYGYNYDKRLLNAADFGAYTSRIRYFGMFAKKGLPMAWPQQTHAKKAIGHLKQWKPVRDVLDFDDHGTSIFNRKKPLSENTLKRIYAGLEKYVGNGHEDFLKKYYSGRPAGKVISTDGPAGTITTIDGHAYVKCQFITQYNGGGHDQRVYDTSRPITTVSTNNRHSVVTPQFLKKYHGNGDNVSSLDDPASTLTTKDRLALIQTQWLDKQYSGSNNHQSIDQPSGTILTVPKHSLVSVEEIQKGDDRFLLNPQFSSKGSSIENPCFTLIARMDKRPPSIVTTEKTNMQAAIAIYETDSDTMVKIKLFMAYHGICDIKMRMLKILELKRIQGFPDDYVLHGTQADQKKFIGNAVHSIIPKKWIEALYTALNKEQLSAA